MDPPRRTTQSSPPIGSRKPFEPIGRWQQKDREMKHTDGSAIITIMEDKFKFIQVRTHSDTPDS